MQEECDKHGWKDEYDDKPSSVITYGHNYPNQILDELRKNKPRAKQ
jgi:hypothetical protein